MAEPIEQHNCVSQEQLYQEIEVKDSVFYFKNRKTPEPSTSSDTKQIKAKKKAKKKDKILQTSRPHQLKQDHPEAVTFDQKKKENDAQVGQMDSFEINLQASDLQEALKVESEPCFEKQKGQKKSRKKSYTDRTRVKKLPKQETKTTKTKPISKRQPINIVRNSKIVETKNIIKNVLIRFKKSTLKLLGIKYKNLRSQRITRLVELYLKQTNGIQNASPQLIDQKSEEYFAALKDGIGREPTRVTYMKLIHGVSDDKVQNKTKTVNKKEKKPILYKKQYCKLTRILFNQFINIHWMSYFLGPQSPYEDEAKKKHLKYMLLFRTSIKDPTFQFDKVKIIEESPLRDKIIDPVPERDKSTEQIILSDEN